MIVDAEALLKLLPALYRLRDAELAPPGGEGPLRRLLAVIATQAAALENDLDQLYDDLFVETCAPWVLPYLAELLGASALSSAPTAHTRAEVAHTIAYRRRKGTTAVLELLAHDVTSWPARAVEFFRLLATTQYLNHVRPDVDAFLDVHFADRLEFLGGPFEDPEDEPAPEVSCNALGQKVGGRPRRRLGTPTHTADVRTIPDRRGRYNIPNVGVFVWPVSAFQLTRSPAVQAFAADRQRFHFHPLGIASWLYNSPQTETDYSSLARPLNVPLPLSRRFLAGHRAACYPNSLAVEIATRDAAGEIVTEPVAKQLADVVVSELSDATGGGTWTRTPTVPGQVAIDPQLGRLVFAAPLAANEVPLVTFQYGSAGAIGGGEYERTRSFLTNITPVKQVANVVRLGLGATKQTLQEALAELPQGGLIEVLDNGRYAPPTLTGLNFGRLEIRAANKRRPVLDCAAVVAIEGQLKNGKAFVELTLNGFLIVGGALKVKNIARLQLRHCTLVPGLKLSANATPLSPDEPSLIVETAGTAGGTDVEIDHCVLGGLRVPRDSSAVVRNSVIDALGFAKSAYSAPAPGFGGSLRVENSTVFGRVQTEVLPLASNSIFQAEGSKPVEVERRQEGCVRFCYLPPGSVVPRRYRCLPTSAAPNAPAFVSLRYGEPGYARLGLRCAPAIRRGADDESELGAFHDLYEPQRLDHLGTRLSEYLRFGMEAGTFPVIYPEPPVGA
jgi:hypothetical protein